MRYAPSLFDKLIGHSHLENQRVGQVMPGLVLSEVMQSVANDLEALLNTRCAIKKGALDLYPLARESVYNYGVADFSSLSLASNSDRNTICESIQHAIQNQDKRLSDVVVSLTTGQATTKRLNFTIRAVLGLSQAGETVNFDGRFEPTVQRYSVVPGIGER
jgi:type VI secretion system protein ImpF